MKTKLFSLLLFFSLSSLFAQSIVDTYLDNAIKQNILNNHEKAYEYINFVLQSYIGEELPDEVKNNAENIYYAYIEKLVDNDRIDMLDELDMNTSQYPDVMSNRIVKALQQLNERKLRQEAEEKRLREEAEVERIRAAEERRLNAETEAREEQRKEYEEKQEALRRERDALLEHQQGEMTRLLIEQYENERQERTEYEQQEAMLKQERDQLIAKQQENLHKLLETTISKNVIEAESTTKLSQNLIILIVVVGVFLFTGFGLLIFLSLRNSNQQQQSFENTIQYLRVSQPQRYGQDVVLSLPGMAPDVNGSPMLIEDHTQKALPYNGEVNMERLKKLIENCYTYGKKIDQITYRKNGSKNTAEMIYKISEQMGYPKQDCMLFFAAGLICDIGFLKIDPGIFQAECITEEQYSILKTHTESGLELINFIDPDLQPVFIDAISKHHENIDGSGYPKGLSGDDIPYIARVIRIVESYISCISSRGYKEIQDQQSAIKELYKNAHEYDESIIKVLEEII